MFGNDEIVSHKAADKTQDQVSCAKQLRDDCGLAAPEQKASQLKVPANKNDLDFTAPVAKAPPNDKPADTAGNPTSLKSEEDFMKIAPALYRDALKMPKDAKSSDLVNKVIGEKVNAFEHAPKAAQSLFLDALHIDKQTAAKIMGHKKDSEKLLADALLTQEKTFLDIPPTLKGESLYQAIEKGIEHNDYQAVVDSLKIQAERSKQ
jgi:hypothetical protein